MTKITPDEALPLIHALLLYNSKSFLSDNACERLSGEAYLATITSVSTPCTFLAEPQSSDLVWLLSILHHRSPERQVYSVLAQISPSQDAHQRKNGIITGSNGLLMKAGGGKILPRVVIICGRKN